MKKTPAIRSNWRRPALSLLLLGITAAACLPKEPGPALKKNAASLLDPNALHVTYAAPEKSASPASQIVLILNRPMRALTQAGHEAPSFATLSPSVPGQWHWIGTQALQFQPQTHLPGATSFRVEVPSGTKALDGAALKKPFVLAFETQRPKLVRTDPPKDRRGAVDLNVAFTLTFNQPIAESELTRALAITASPTPENSESGDKTKKIIEQTIEFETSYPDPQRQNVLGVRPKRPLPKASDIHFHVDNSLKGKEGPLPSSETQDITFHTPGPLRALRIHCESSVLSPRACEPSVAGVDLFLSNPVTEKEAWANITIDPTIPFEITSTYEENGQGIVVLVADWEKNKTYQIKIGRGLNDIYGQPIDRETQLPLEMGPHRPAIGFGFNGSRFLPADLQPFSVVSVNQNEFDMAYAPLDENAMLKLLTPPEPDGYADIHSLSPEKIAELPSAIKKRIQGKAPLNQPFVFQIPGADLFGQGKKTGAFAVAYTQKHRKDYEQSYSALVQATDIALTAKIANDGSYARVTRLSTGKPIAGAHLSIRRPAGPSNSIAFISDSNGFVDIPAQSFKPDAFLFSETAVFVARSGDDWTFLPVNATVAARDGWASVGEPYPIGLMFSERHLYRPGETAHIKGIIRKELRAGIDHKARIPAGKTIRVALSIEGRKPLDEKTAEVSRFGTFSLDIAIPKTAPLGYVRAEAKLAGEEQPIEDTLFEIAEYRPNEISVRAHPVRSEYIQGEQASFRIHAESYSGTPLAGQSVRIVFWREEDSFRPPDLPEDYFIGDKAYASELQSYRKSLLSRSDIALDAFGSGQFQAGADLPGQMGPERLICSAEVGDEGGQPVAARATALVHPGEFYLALQRGAQGFLNAGNELKPMVLAVDPKGKAVSNISVRVELIERRREHRMGRGSRTKPEDSVIASCSLVSGPAPQSCALPPPGSGDFILRAASADKSGHKIAASQWIYIAPAAQKQYSRDGESLDLDLIADRNQYNIGDTAKILIKSPFDQAQALIGVERAGTYSKRLMELRGPSPIIEVPITQEMWPNAFVSVLLTRGVQKNEGPGPAYRFGVVPISLRPEAQKLSVTVSADKKEALPGSELGVEVFVRDPHGRPAAAEVTLYAVDEGVLSLTGERRPDPVSVFSQPRSLGVATLESRDLLGKYLGPEEALDGLGQIRMGAGHGSLGARERRDFRATAYYNPTLITNAQGKIKTRFTLPDSLTSYRIVAVAVQEGDATGSAETRVRTGQDLMLRPLAPQFVRSGDTLSAGALVSSRLPGKNEIELEIQSEGMEPLGQTRTRISLEKDQSREVRFSFRAGRVGKAKLSISARAEKASDAVVIERGIESPAALETVALYGQTSAEAREKIGPLEHVRADVGGLSVELSNSALSGLSGSLEQLLDYPYNCTEQLASRLVGLVASRGLFPTAPVPAPKDLEQRLLRSLEAAQKPDGGFGYWPGSHGAEPFVSAYALLALAQAKQAGIAVREPLFKGAVQFLTDWLSYRSESPYAYADAVFVADALVEAETALHGRVTQPRLPKWIRNIIAHHKRLPPASLAVLLHAAAKAGPATAAPAELNAMRAALESSIRLDGPNAQVIEPGWNYESEQLDSNVRTSALALRALLAADPAHPLGARLVQGLLSARKASGWRTTQENAWVLAALSAYRQAQESKGGAGPATLSLSGQTLGTAEFQAGAPAAFEFSAPISALIQAKQLNIHSEVAGPLFYSARLRYAPEAMPEEPMERGFFVQRSQRAVRPEDLTEALASPPAPAETSFTQGDLLLVDLLMVVPTPRDHIVLEDPIAAGIEPVHTAFATTSEWLAKAADEGARRNAEKRTYQYAWHREELRDDRALFFIEHAPSGLYRFQYLARAVTPGTFQQPPARAEQMYAPEIFGRTQGNVIRVRETPPKP